MLVLRCCVPEATIYNCEVEVCRLEASKARRLMLLEEESGNFKRLLTAVMLEKAALTRRAAYSRIC